MERNDANTTGTLREVCLEEITLYGGGFGFFFAAINSTERTEIVFIENVTLNAHLLITEVLIPCAHPARTAVEEDSIFKDDNARPYRFSDVEGIIHARCWDPTLRLASSKS